MKSPFPVRKLLAVSSAFLLISCGQDKDDEPEPAATSTPAPTPAPTPTPAPSPTPSPSPTPTPTPTSSAVGFDALTGTTSLNVSTAGLTFTGGAPAAANVDSATTLSYDATAKSYAVSRTGASDTFAAAEIDGSAPAGTTRYVKANGRVFTVTRPVAGSGLDYVRFADYRLGAQGSATEYPLLIGLVTPGSDVPSSGTVSYTRTVVAGDAYVTTGSSTVAYSLAKSTLTITIDFATGRATSKLVLVGTPKSGGADVALITVDGTTDFGGNLIDARFSGTDFTNVTAGTLAGAVFGPKAAEAGLLISLTGSSADSGKKLVLVAMGAAGR